MTRVLDAEGRIKISGPVGGSGTTPQIAYWTAAQTLGGDADLTWDVANDRIVMGDGASIGQVAGGLVTFNDTSNRLELAGGTGTTLYVDGALMFLAANNSYLIFSGGNATNVGGNVIFYGGAHATYPDMIELRASANARLWMAAAGHWYPHGVKTQDLGLATNEWDDIFYVTSNVGTSRLVRSTRVCPVCSTEMKRGTGTTVYRGEAADYAVCFCLNCGNAAVEELNHLPPERELEKRPPPKIVLESIRVKTSGRNRSVAVDFRYGDDVLDGDGNVIEQAVRNSTRLGEYELGEFLATDDAGRLAFLLGVGRREWDAREEARLMREEAAALETEVGSKVASLLGTDLLQLEAG